MDQQPASVLIIKRRDAIARGVGRYFTGRACKAGHVAERYTKNGACVACLKAYAADYYQTRKEGGAKAATSSYMKVIHVPSVDCVIVAAEPMNAEQSEVFRRGLIDALEKGPWPPAQAMPEGLIGDSAVLKSSSSGEDAAS